ncbi:carboxypeptidase-like regulatory domain-containing protein [Pedobacter sp.]
MPRFFLSFLLIFTISFSKAQTLQGKVVDINTGEAIPFVSIGILGTNNATVTNDAGEFVLKNISFPAKLRFSHVSYFLAEQEIDTENNNLMVKLQPAAINLKPVVIDPYLGQRILKKALEKAKTYEKQTFYGKAFYRQLTAINGKPSQIYELFYDLNFDITKVNGWIANQSRYAQLNEGISFSMNNQSFLTFSFAGYLFEEKKGNLTKLKTLKDFEITVEKYIEQKDQDIAVISCKFKGNKKQFYVNSTYYVGMDDHNIYRLENSIFNLPLKTTNSNLLMPPVASTIATFNKKESAIPILENVSTKLYVNLNIGGVRINSIVSSMLTLYQLHKNLNDKKFIRLKIAVNDKETVESLKYDPDFWQNNPIVKQTALEDSFIKMMESKSAFGTMINPN